MYTLMRDVIFFARAQVIQAALKNTLLLRHTWREVLHGRLHFGKVWRRFDNSWIPERVKPSMFAGGVLLQDAGRNRYLIASAQANCDCLCLARALPLLCLRFAFVLPLFCLPFFFPFEWGGSPKLSTKQEPTTKETNTQVNDRKHSGEA